MKKWVAAGAACVVATAVISATAWAKSGLNLFINDMPYTADYLKLKVENGTTMVPLRKIVDEFRGQVTADKNNIRITLPNATDLAHQVSQFESALEATTPEEAVNTWIKGIQNRNGSLQYAVLSPTLRKQTLKDFNTNYWVTGGSSPHMGKVKLPAPVQLSKDKVQFTFEYPLVVMEQDIDKGKAQITVQKLTENERDRWVISNIKLKVITDTGTMIGAEELK